LNEGGRSSRLLLHFGAGLQIFAAAEMLRQSILVPRTLGILQKALLGSVDRPCGQLVQETARATCLLCGLQNGINKRALHTSLPRCKVEDRKEMLASMPRKDDGTEGAKTFDIDLLSRR
jgi:hypothetical protein